MSNKQQRLALTIEAESESLQKGISKAVSSLQEMSETAKTSGREQTESMNALAESTKGVASSIERVNSTQKKTYDNLAQS